MHESIISSYLWCMLAVSFVSSKASEAKAQGWQIEGIVLKNWNRPDTDLHYISLGKFENQVYPASRNIALTFMR